MTVRSRTWISLLLIVFSACWAASVFRFFDDRFTAALLAGVVFSISQTIIICLFLWARSALATAMIGFASLNLGVFSIPQMALRIANSDRPSIMDIPVFGIEFYWIHKASQMSFLIQLVFVSAALIDSYRSRKKLSK